MNSPYSCTLRSAALPLDQLLSSPPRGASSEPLSEQLIAQYQALLTMGAVGTDY